VPEAQKKLYNLTGDEFRSQLAHARSARKAADKLYWPALLEQLRRQLVKNPSWAEARYLQCELREMKDTDAERLFDYWAPLDLQNPFGDSLLGGGIDNDLNELLAVSADLVRAYSEQIHLKSEVNYVYFIDLLEHKALSLEEFDS
jgi:hypothetical protein